MGKNKEDNNKKDLKESLNHSKESDAKKPKVIVVTNETIEDHRTQEISKIETKKVNDEHKQIAEKIRNVELKYISKTLRSNRKQILFTILFGMIVSFTITYFINSGGLFQLGISGISQGFSYMIAEIYDTNVSSAEELQNIQVVSFWLIYLFLNIPILIFAYYKFNSKFFILTITMVISNIAFGFIWLSIPGLTDYTFILDGLTGGNPEAESIAIVIMGTIGGVIFGLVAGLTFKNGGSTGGADPLVRHIGRTKGINIGTINFILSAIFITFFTILNDFILEESSQLANETKDATSFFQVIFSPVVIASAIFIAISSGVLDRVFPMRKTLSISINTEFGETLSNEFNKKEWSRGHNIQLITGGRSKKKRYIISMIINSRELPSLIDFVHKIDKNCLITTQPIEGTFGNYDRKEKIKDDELIERQEYRRKIHEENKLRKKRHEEEKKKQNALRKEKKNNPKKK